MPRVTLNKVNNAIRDAGGTESLVRGNGYFYFIDMLGTLCISSGICVNHLNALSLEEWLSELEDKRTEHRSNYRVFDASEFSMKIRECENDA